MVDATFQSREIANAPSPAADQDVLCPLCGYNLRGLTEARCPECGGKFNWPDLLDPTRKRHPFLFEHHPERNVRSFIQTAIGGLMPRRFWRALHPSQPSRPRRLALYWLICAALCTLPAVIRLVVDGINVRSRMLVQRAEFTSFFTHSGTGNYYLGFATKKQIEQALHRYGSINRAINRIAPEPTMRRLLRILRPTRYLRPSPDLARGYVLRSWSAFTEYALLLWPIVMTLGLMLLRTTMRQASIHPSHLFRVTVYSADVLIWVVAAQLLVIGMFAIQAYLPLGRNVFFITTTNVAQQWLVYLPPVAELVAAYRLAVAVHHYLRFRHAVAIAVAMQIILLLITLQMMALLVL